MISALFNQPNYVAARRMLDVAMARHEAIASNLANIETPGYKRMDVSPAFENELRQAIASKDTSRITALTPKLEVDATAVARNRDGNTVQLEQELLKLNQNSLAYAVETQMITGTLVKLRLAITGRPV